MSTDYSGFADNITIPASVGITAATNATPIEITTGAAHGLISGDLVRITGVAGNYAANGLHSVTWVSSTKYTLQVPLTHTDVAGVAAYTSGGSSYKLTPEVAAIPDDGDAAAASSWNVATEALSDRAAFAFTKFHRSRLLGEVASAVDDDDTFASWADNTFTNAGWTEMTAASTFLDVVVDILPGDIVDVTFQTTFDTTADATALAVSLYALEYDYGVSATYAASALIPGTAIYLAASTRSPFVLHGSFTVATTRGKRMRFYLSGLGSTAGAKRLDLDGSHQLHVRVYRSGTPWI